MKLNHAGAALLTLLLGVPMPLSQAQNLAEKQGQVVDLSLAGAFEFLEASNPDLKSAKISATIARIQATRTRLNRYAAQAAITGGYGLNLNKVFGQDTALSHGINYDAGLSASIPLYTGGRVEAQITQAEMDSALSDVTVLTTRRGLERAVYLAYWNILSFELQLKASEDALAINEEALEFIIARSNAGLAAPIDVNRSQVNALNQRDQIFQLQNQRYQSIQDLLSLLDLQADDINLLDSAQMATRDWPKNADELVETAIAKRPEMKAFEHRETRAEAGVELARSGAMPTVSLNASAGMSASENWGQYYAYGLDGQIAQDADGATQFSEVERDFSHLTPALGANLGLNFSWTPFNLFQVRDQVAMAKEGVSQIDAQRESQRLGLERDIRSAHNSVLVLRQRTPVIEERLKLSRDNLEIIQALYAQGSSNLLDLFNAQSAYQGAVVQMASHQVNLVVADYELRWTLGESMVGE